MLPLFRSLIRWPRVVQSAKTNVIISIPYKFPLSELGPPENSGVLDSRTLFGGISKKLGMPDLEILVLASSGEVNLEEMTNLSPAGAKVSSKHGLAPSTKRFESEPISLIPLCYSISG